MQSVEGREGRAPNGEPISNGRRRLQSASSEAAACALQTYWSASGRIWAIDAIARKATTAVEREVLEQLRGVEQQRATLARDALAEIWGITLRRSA